MILIIEDDDIKLCFYENTILMPSGIQVSLPFQANEKEYTENQECIMSIKNILCRCEFVWISHIRWMALGDGKSI